MKDHYEEVRRLGGEVVAVSFTPPSRVASYLKKYPLPFPAVSDPKRQAYRAFALGQASWLSMLRLGVMYRYLRLILRGWRVQKPREDIHQLGGDFVLDDRRRLVFAYRSREPTDRPSIEQLLEAIRSAG